MSERNERTNGRLSPILLANFVIFIYLYIFRERRSCIHAAKKLTPSSDIGRKNFDLNECGGQWDGKKSNNFIECRIKAGEKVSLQTDKSVGQ